MEALLAQHRKEKKDLQSKITQKKKGATKKSRKGVNDECDALERDLAERQAAEVAAFGGDRDGIGGVGGDAGDNDSSDGIQDTSGETSVTIGGPPSDSAEQITTAVSNLNVASPDSKEPNSSPNSVQAPQRKPNRNKARFARRAAEREALADEAAEEAQYMPDLKAREREAMTSEFRRRGLTEKEIRADGHCLYSAIAFGLKQQELGLSPRIPLPSGDANGDSIQVEDYRLMRQVAAKYMSKHPDDFAPFLEEPLETYVKKVSDTGEWGGQLELLALAKAYGVDINVIQGDGRVEEIHGEGEDRKQLWLAYYKHNFGLGEHYNSLGMTI